MDMAERIKERRKALGYTQEELAEKVGVQKSAIAKYENGRVTNMKRSMIEKMSSVLECAPSYLLGFTDDDQAATVPVVGRVAAGIPIAAVEEILDVEEIDNATARSGEYFALRIKGDSMEPRMCDGDVVIVRKQDTAESGDIVIASVNGNDATCKRLKVYDGGIALVSINPNYEPMYFSREEIENTPIRIWGKVVELRGKF